MVATFRMQHVDQAAQTEHVKLNATLSMNPPARLHIGAAAERNCPALNLTSALSHTLHGPVRSPEFGRCRTDKSQMDSAALAHFGTPSSPAVTGLGMLRAQDMQLQE